MKYLFIGPGFLEIPPTGWGAVEILINDYRESLQKKGHEVIVVNTKIPDHIVALTNAFDPDFVHIQYDDYAFLADYINCKNKVITSHFAYLEQPHLWPKHYVDFFWKTVNSDLKIFCLSEGIMDIYKKGGVSSDRLFLNPNGVRTDLFRFSNDPSKKDKSICLGKIDKRKRQYLLQEIKDIEFVGNRADDNFDYSNKNWLGEWNKDTLYKNLTDYGNLVLLSDGEAHPLVVMEALSAGLGVVVSECASANLDTSLPFVTVVEEETLNNTDRLSIIIEENRKISIENRSSIRDYALSKDWMEIVDQFYIPNSNKVMEHIKIL